MKSPGVRSITSMSPSDPPGLPGVLPQTADPGGVRGQPAPRLRLRRGVGRRRHHDSGDGGGETSREVRRPGDAQPGRGGADAAGGCEEPSV